MTSLEEFCWAYVLASASVENDCENWPPTITLYAALHSTAPVEPAATVAESIERAADSAAEYV